MKQEKYYAAIQIDPNDVGINKVQANDTTLNNIFGAIYIIIGALALFYIVRAALLFVTSGSDPSSVKDARETILYAVVALVGSTAVIALVQFVLASLN
jgi:hypothetical protein